LFTRQVVFLRHLFSPTCSQVAARPDYFQAATRFVSGYLDMEAFDRLSFPVPARPRSCSAVDRSRDGLGPGSGPSNPDPGPMDGESGNVAEPRSGLLGGTSELGAESRSRYRSSPPEALGARDMPGLSDDRTCSFRSERRD
jgi:hypothetical protein